MEQLYYETLLIHSVHIEKGKNSWFIKAVMGKNSDNTRIKNKNKKKRFIYCNYVEF